MHRRVKALLAAVAVASAGLFAGGLIGTTPAPPDVGPPIVVPGDRPATETELDEGRHVVPPTSERIDDLDDDDAEEDGDDDRDGRRGGDRSGSARDDDADDDRNERDDDSGERQKDDGDDGDSDDAD